MREEEKEAWHQKAEKRALLLKRPPVSPVGSSFHTMVPFLGLNSEGTNSDFFLNFLKQFINLKNVAVWLGIADGQLCSRKLGKTCTSQ